MGSLLTHYIREAEPTGAAASTVTMSVIQFGPRETWQMPAMGSQYKLVEFDSGKQHYWLYVNFPATLMTLRSIGKSKVDDLLKRLAVHKEFLQLAFQAGVACRKPKTVKELKSYRTITGKRVQKVYLQDDSTPDPNIYELALGKLLDKLFEQASFTARSSERSGPDALHGKDIPNLGAPPDVTADLAAIEEFKSVHKKVFRNAKA